MTGREDRQGTTTSVLLLAVRGGLSCTTLLTDLRGEGLAPTLLRSRGDRLDGVGGDSCLRSSGRHFAVQHGHESRACPHSFATRKGNFLKNGLLAGLLRYCWTYGSYEYVISQLLN